MSVQFLRAACVALGLLLVAPSTSGQLVLESLLPAEGTLGTPLDLRLLGELGKGKPKLWLTLAEDPAPQPKVTRLTLSGLTDLGRGVTSLAVSFKRCKTGPGLYDLHVQPKGQAGTVFEDAFTVRAPLVDELSSSSAAAKASLTLGGQFFGSTGKPKVTLLPAEGGKGKRAKVLKGGTDTTLELVLPKVTPGLYDLLVANRAGQVLLEDALTITAGPGPGGGGGDSLTGTLANDTIAMLTDQLDMPSGLGGSLQALHPPVPGTPTLIITGSMTVGGAGGLNFGLSLSIPFDPGNTPLPFSVSLSADVTEQFNITANQKSVSSGEGPNWYAGFGDVADSWVTITSDAGGRVVGTFHATLLPGDDNPGAGTVTITDGAFDVAVQ